MTTIEANVVDRLPEPPPIKLWCVFVWQEGCQYWRYSTSFDTERKAWTERHRREKLGRICKIVHIDETAETGD